MKVGIYGGSFNPIHKGHIKLAAIFLQQVGLDEVWFMVSPQNPFKINDKLLDDKLRLQLVKSALAGQKRYGRLVITSFNYRSLLILGTRYNDFLPTSQPMNLFFLSVATTGKPSTSGITQKIY